MRTKFFSKKSLVVLTLLSLILAVLSVDLVRDSLSVWSWRTTNVAADQPVPDLWFKGQWSGQVEKNGRMLSVILAIDSLKPGQQGGVLRYGGNRACTAQGTYEGRRGQQLIFSLFSQNGGSFCDQIDQLVVEKTEDKLSYVVSSGDGKLYETGRLGR